MRDFNVTGGFIRRYDPSGNSTWAQRFGGSSFDYAFGVAAEVSLGGGGARDYLYQGANNGLVGSLLDIDVPFGTCSRAVYETQFPDLKACADYSICDLCPGGSNPCSL